MLGLTAAIAGSPRPSGRAIRAGSGAAGGMGVEARAAASACRPGAPSRSSQIGRPASRGCLRPPSARRPWSRRGLFSPAGAALRPWWRTSRGRPWRTRSSRAAAALGFAHPAHRSAPAPIGRARRGRRADAIRPAVERMATLLPFRGGGVRAPARTALGPAHAASKVGGSPRHSTTGDDGRGCRRDGRARPGGPRRRRAPRAVRRSVGVRAVPRGRTVARMALTVPRPGPTLRHRPPTRAWVPAAAIRVRDGPPGPSHDASRSRARRSRSRSRRPFP